MASISARGTSHAKKILTGITVTLTAAVSLASPNASAHVSVGIGFGVCGARVRRTARLLRPAAPASACLLRPATSAPVVVYQTVPAPVVYGEDWRQREWREHEWRERREWRERQEYERRRAYYGY